ncbi:MAG: phosphoribosylanthranilate isomerase [Paracoccaceae bacterium]|nr:phosphoribosylanthranilate isomerase [Paracoccaceae bacterium]
MPNTRVKICGLTTRQSVSAAVEAGAAYIGFNFIERSSRYVSIEAARDLAVEVPPGVAKVALTIDADDAELDAITDVVPLDMLQLHGAETPERVTEVKARYGLPVMKAVGIADASDLAALDTYAPVADQLLVDTKPPKSGDLPGGTGLAFDWRLIANRRWSTPWMLAGGLTPGNVAEAIALTGATQVDVASGVESAPGVKDAELIRAFVEAAG